MKEKRKISISVRNLVEFVLRAGDLDNTFSGNSRALEGTRVHQKIQRERKKAGDYSAEVFLKYSFEYTDYLFTVEGRADGILKKDERTIIEEIKTTTKSLDYVAEGNRLHWAQAKVYGYLYLLGNDLTEIDIQLTYYQLETEEVKIIKDSFTREQLENFFKDLVQNYLEWAEFNSSWLKKRDESIIKLDFPFPTYRKGQRELAVAVYKTIVEKKNLFVQAATGIGKTISTLFPAVKSLGEGLADKIFYLTAKTINRKVAEDTIITMVNNGLEFKVLTLTAKDKICFQDKTDCNPEYCQYAKGHFDRVNKALWEILTNENIIRRETILDYAERYQICPFEFSLDLISWADCVICDYNYLYDPRVGLKRVFADNTTAYLFLIDEAHNLVDRAREMFSADINMADIERVKELLPKKETRMNYFLQEIILFLQEYGESRPGREEITQKEAPLDLYPLLWGFSAKAEEWLVKEGKNTQGYDELLDLYFSFLSFLRITDLYDDRFVTYLSKDTAADFKLKLYCLDPSYLLKEVNKVGRAVVFFSATLTPLNYFCQILGGSETDYKFALPSPFAKENLCLLIADNISTRYKDRERSCPQIAEYIGKAVSQKKGNYLVFFPSYKYMNDVYTSFQGKYAEIYSLVQSPNMTEREREDFIGEFKADLPYSMVGFAVLGGIFSEGIDLKGERLLGTIVVGVGHPQICLEREIIRDYFQTELRQGYEYAYTYPGMNKVFQAAGRTIRSEGDRGFIFLIGERFSSYQYKRLFPKEWFFNKRVKDSKDIEKFLQSFWAV